MGAAEHLTANLEFVVEIPGDRAEALLHDIRQALHDLSLGTTARVEIAQ